MVYDAPKSPGKGKGRAKQPLNISQGKFTQRDIIPPDFFADLHGAVDSLLHHEVQKVVARPLDIPSSMAKRPSKSPAGRSRVSFGQTDAEKAKGLSEWASHPSFQTPLFPNAVAAFMATPVLGSTQKQQQERGPESEQTLQFSLPGEATLRPPSDAQTVAGGAHLGTTHAQDRIQDEQGFVKARVGGLMRSTTRELSDALEKDAMIALGRHVQSRTTIEGDPADYDPTAAALQGKFAHSIHTKSDDDLAMKVQGSPKLVQDEPSNAMVPKKHSFKYTFDSSARGTDVRAADFREALERLRQYLVMKYGSFKNAFHKLELSGDLTGLMGSGHH